MRVVLTSRAHNQLRKLKPETIEKLKQRISNLRYFPFLREDIKKIKGIENTYRMRVGKYRILFEVDYANDTIMVFNISYRDKAYRGI